MHLQKTNTLANSSGSNSFEISPKNLITCFNTESIRKPVTKRKKNNPFQPQPNSAAVAPEQ